MAMVYKVDLWEMTIRVWAGMRGAVKRIGKISWWRREVLKHNRFSVEPVKMGEGRGYAKNRLLVYSSTWGAGGGC